MIQSAMVKALATFLSAAALSGVLLLSEGHHQGVPLNTWTIVAADPASGDVGVAGASCVPMPIDAIAALVPGKGAAATQAFFDLGNRNEVYELLGAGKSSAE